MSESYTVGENASLNVDWKNRCSQSFTPVIDHVLHYVDLTLKPVAAAHWPVCSIYEADVNGKPTGDMLIKAYAWDYPFWVWGFRKRCRFYFNDLLLEAGKQYCITLHTWDSIYPTIVYWYYNQGAGDYPRGCRAFSTDYGASWTAYPNDDMMFAEFGTPPTPPPLPNPPIANFTVLDVETVSTEAGVQFLVTTNVPCFLKMYWTASEPLKHATEILLRGQFWKNRIRFCFINWDENDQEELSDGVYHTFIKEPWDVCETRWFTFKAKIDGVWSPSVSAIFKHHRTTPPPPAIFYSDPHPEFTSVDGMVGRTWPQQSWAGIRDGVGNYVRDLTVSFHIWLRSTNPSGRKKYYELRRAFQLFDLSIGLGKTVASASLHLYLASKADSHSKNPSIAVVETWPVSTVELANDDYHRIGTTLLAPKKWYDDVVVLEWLVFNLNAAGIALINSALSGDGIVKLGLREGDYDLLDIDPLYGIANAHWNFGFHSSDYADNNRPYLKVVWS